MAERWPLKTGPAIRLILSVGAWRSLVAHMLGVHEVAGSNPVAPTNFLPR